jgi:hypothetical protein
MKRTTIAFLLLSVCFGCTLNRDSSGRTSLYPGSSSGDALTSRSEIFTGSFTVTPGEYYPIPFEVPTGGRIVGSFKSNTNIMVAVVDEANYQQITSGQRFYSHYYSGKIGAGSINVLLPSGRYYVVFANTYSIISSKQVYATLHLEQ